MAKLYIIGFFEPPYMWVSSIGPLLESQIWLKEVLDPRVVTVLWRGAIVGN